MNQPLDDQYLTWLYEMISGPETSRSRSFNKLAHQLYTKEFVWFVPNDDNRVEDGKYLRYEFADELELQDIDPDWMDLGCSFLEMLIGLSRRLEFQADGNPREWFWHLINNLGLRYSDRGNYPDGVINEVLDTVIWRTYDYSGAGGLFPLRHPDRDQREIEIWAQLQDYLLER